MVRRLVVILGCVCVCVVALLAWPRDDSSRGGGTSAIPAAPDGDARSSPRGLGALERARLRERILAGNARLAAVRPDAGAGSGDVAGLQPAPDEEGDGSGEPAETARSPSHREYHDVVFAVASDIIDDCRGAYPDAGARFKVSYVVIADDTEGGLFEQVTLPADGNTSGAETLECIMERMLGATLPAPHADISRFMFELEIEIQPSDAGPS